MESTQERLASAYHCALGTLPTHWLDQSRKHDVDFAHLSGLFLPGTCTKFEQASKRIMVVGRETRRWDVVKPENPYRDLDEYIHRAMDIQQKYLFEHLKAKADRGESFFNFLRKLHQPDGSIGIAWANLFSFAWRSGSPMSWRHFECTQGNIEKSASSSTHYPQTRYCHFRQWRQQCTHTTGVLSTQRRIQCLRRSWRLSRARHTGKPALAFSSVFLGTVLPHPASKQRQH